MASRSGDVVRPTREADYGATLPAKLGAFVEARETLVEHVRSCHRCMRGEMCIIGHAGEVVADACAVSVGLIGRKQASVDVLCQFGLLLGRAEDLIVKLDDLESAEAWVKDVLRKVQTQRRVVPAN
jgi:hypothetical protein